ncbi:MAG: type IX secretion system outer membrane channel protein PorV [Cytophagales bacterium]|nr:type IX secretion system outer membrane channel protein PorV [Cytophagales bacterium]
MYKNIIIHAVVISAAAIYFPALSQPVIINQNDVDKILRGAEDDTRPITTAVPFMGITPNATAAAVGDQGVATKPDEYSAYWNPAKIIFNEKDYGAGLCVNPWLRNLGVNDMYIGYLTAYYKLRKEDALAVHLTYFDLGSIQFTNNDGAPLGDFNPREYIVGASYSRMLGRGFSSGLSIKYIESNLTGSFTNSTGGAARPGRTAAADIGFYYNRDIVMFDRDFNLSAGLSISNIGGKINYSNNNRADFIPTILRLGSGLTYEVDDFNKFGFFVEASKLLVPSPQIVYLKKVGLSDVDSLTADGAKIPATPTQYFTPNKGIVDGMFTSFGDAPFGASEEFKEIMFSFGVEYWYDNLFALRTGYFHENAQKGNRKYFCVGFGLRYQTVGLDLAYIIPTVYNHPLANTIRISVSVNMNKPEKDQESVIE